MLEFDFFTFMFQDRRYRFPVGLDHENIALEHADGDVTEDQQVVYKKLVQAQAKHNALRQAVVKAFLDNHFDLPSFDGYSSLEEVMTRLPDLIKSPSATLNITSRSLDHINSLRIIVYEQTRQTMFVSELPVLQLPKNLALDFYKEKEVRIAEFRWPSSLKKGN
jgi:hypothetical protein